MHINAQTKISGLLKGHPDALEAIVSISPEFRKLRNPVLRKLMAGRTSIAMAARIGGCKPEDFFSKLAPLGFEADAETPVSTRLPEENKPFPKRLQSLPAASLVTLDVRAMLSEGNDPLRLIQKTLKELQRGQVLRIINTFEPTPLIMLLQKQGFEAYVNRQGDELVVTYFYRVADADADVEALPSEIADDWDALLERHKGNLEEVDVRQLEMPAPMMTILELLDRLPSGKALLVHHKRVPVFLLSELKDRGFEYRIREESPGQVNLLIMHRAG